MRDEPVRCPWATTDPLYIAYHDVEWGVPQHNDTRLFEMLLLEGAQAGLSWLTILRKRDAFRKAFAGFDYTKVARFTPAHAITANAHDYEAPMAPGDRRYLAGVFEAEIRQLERLLGWDCSDWLSEAT